MRRYYFPPREGAGDHEDDTNEDTNAKFRDAIDPCGVGGWSSSGCRAGDAPVAPVAPVAADSQTSEAAKTAARSAIMVRR